MRQVEKYLLKIALLLGIFIMPFAASAEEVDMGEKSVQILKTIRDLPNFSPGIGYA